MVEAHKPRRQANFTIADLPDAPYVANLREKVEEARVEFQRRLGRDMVRLDRVFGDVSLADRSVKAYRTHLRGILFVISRSGDWESGIMLLGLLDDRYVPCIVLFSILF